MATTAPWRPAGVDLAGCSGMETNLYAIQEGDDGPVKIGLARHPTDRLSTLQQGNPRSLRLLCAIPICAQAEKRLHAALAEHSARGEWFLPSDEVMAAVAELKELARMVNDYRSDQLPDFGADDMDVILMDHSLARV